MTRTAVATLIILGAVLSTAARAQTIDPDARVVEAAVAAGCQIPEEQTDVGVVAVLPGSDPSLRVVATITGGIEEALGDLCVAVVRQAHGRSFLVAGLKEILSPPATIPGMSTPSLSVRPQVFRVAPGIALFAVDVSDRYDSTATGVSGTTTHLFRVDGARLRMILSVRTAEITLDKDSGDEDRSSWTLTTARRGGSSFADIVATDVKRHVRRYVWDGARYANARTTRR